MLYIQFVGYLVEDCTKFYKVSKLEAVNSWTFVNAGIYILLTIALGCAGSQ